MSPADSISVLVPAYNEAANLPAAAAEILAAVEGQFTDYEVLLFNDGSTDRTGEVAEELAAARPHVRVIHNRPNAGMGRVFREGLRLARMDYVILVNGKHDIAAAELRKIFDRRGQADLVISHHVNGRERPLLRRIVSRSYTTLLNLLLGYRLPYYNDSVLYRRELLQSLSLRTDSYAFAAEALVKGLRRGCSFVLVPIRNLYPPGVPTKAFRWRNVAGVAKALAWLVHDVYWRGRVPA